MRAVSKTRARGVECRCCAAAQQRYALLVLDESRKSTVILCKVLSGRRWLYPVRSVLWAAVPPLYGLLWCSLCRLACVARLGRFVLVSVLVLILGLNDVVCHGRQYGGSFMGVFARIPWLVLRMCQAWLVSKIAGGFSSGTSVWGGGLLVVGLLEGLVE